MSPAHVLQRHRDRARARDGYVLDELVQELGEQGARSFARSLGVEVVLSVDEVAQVLPRGPELYVSLKAGGMGVLLKDPWGWVSPPSGRDLSPGPMTAAAEPMGVGEAVATALAQQKAEPLQSPGSGRTVGPATSPGLTEVQATDVVGFVNQCLEHAYGAGASDLHFECDRRGVTAKQRLDGVMNVMARLEGRDRAEEVISRIKVLAQLDITERRLPQDGRFRHTLQAIPVDFRVSIMPSVHGEDAVLRVLDKSRIRAEQDVVTLDSLGFETADASLIRMLATQPSGMLLVTGPTGSGKTTTLYAALSEINNGLEKIITIEDPVEYELPGVLQIPVNERKGLTFARGLRSILRHDPDRILVGEIRDPETAAIAVQSALTGHLVFTTVHANSLFDVIGRFRHFGIDLFGFVSSLNGVVVQRLMRKLCPHCAQHKPASEAQRRWLAGRGVEMESVPLAVGCPACHHTGYKGRVVLAEVHQVSDRFRDRVMQGAELGELKAIAFDGGPTPLPMEAMRLVLSRQTTLEEVFRVVGQA